MKALTTILLTLLMSMGAWGAEISSPINLCDDEKDFIEDPYWCNAPAWQIDGAIEKGDYERLKSILKKDLISKLGWLSSQRLDFVNNTEYSISALEKLYSVWRPTISVNSTGGDVLESIQIGRLIRQLRMDVSVYKPSGSTFEIKCLSACMNIRIAGINGLASNDFNFYRYSLGVHRPSFNDDYFAGLNSSEAETLYLKYENEVKAYMQEMGATKTLIDLTFNTPSSEIQMIDRTLNAGAITYSSIPWWEERVDANCSSWSVENNKKERLLCATMLQVRDSLSSAKEYFK